MLNALSLALALATPTAPTSHSHTFVVGGDAVWWDYQVQSEPLSRGCRVLITKEKGGTGTPHHLRMSIDMVPGQSLTMQESGGAVIVRCDESNRITADGPR